MVRRTVLGAAVVLLLMLCGECFAAKSAANAQTRAQLDRVLPAVNFSNVTLKDAIDFLRDVSGSNIHVNWKAIEAAGITQDTAINIKLRQVSLRKVLGLLLSEASGGVGLTFYIDDGVIEITTTELANQKGTELREGLARLGERKRLILELRFGLDGNDPRNLEEIGRIVGLTRERVRQLEAEALRELAASADMQPLRAA